MDHIHSNTIEDVRISGRHLSLEERGMIHIVKGFPFATLCCCGRMCSYDCFL